MREDILEAVISIAKECNMEQVVLFGSRARGDYRKESDIDLAVYGGDPNRFALELEERAPTLLRFDVVDMNAAMQKELRKSVEREGVRIYEKV